MKTDHKIETFKQYLTRMFAVVKSARPKAPKLAWGKENSGEGLARWDGKNEQKRTRRAAAKLDRLAHIRAVRQMHDGHVPKLKRVPASVFE